MHPAWLFALLAVGADVGPIPDPTALLKDVRAHQGRMDEIRENYTWTRTRESQQLDGHGKVQSNLSEKSECFFVNGRQVRRVVARNGKPLSVVEQRQEADRIQKRVEALLKMPVTKRRGDISLVSEILPVARVSNPKRIDFRGRPTLMFDFEGDPKAAAHSMEQKAGKDIVGAIWVDEGDRQIARLEVTFRDTFRIGGGLLASFQKGTTIFIDQARVEDGLWMMSAMDEHLDARIAVFKSMRENVHLRDTDFRKFDVGVLQKNGAPRP